MSNNYIVNLITTTFPHISAGNTAILLHRHKEVYADNGANLLALNRANRSIKQGI